MQQQQARPQASGSAVASETSLFAGLSFPEVPTSLIVPRQRAAAEPGGQDAGHSRAEPVAEGTEMVSLESSSSAPQVVQALVQSASLASLYAPAPIARNYPDLSRISGSGSGSGSLARPRMAPSSSFSATGDADESVGLLSTAASAPPAVGDDEPHSAFATGTAAAAVTAAAAAATASATATTSSTSASADPTNASLIHDLMLENARLAEENSRLQRAFALQQAQQAQQRVPAVVASPVGPQTQYMQPTIVSGQGLGAHQSAPAQGIRVSGSTPPAQREGVKYVCCGTCRQWLLSPRDAAFVYCPQCRCINNCGALPPPTAGHHQLNSTGARPGSTLSQPERWELPPYIQDCFRGIWR